MFMSSCFCAYARKRKLLELLPLTEMTNQELETKTLDDVKMVAAMSSPKQYIKEKTLKESSFMDIDEEGYRPTQEDEEFSSIFPLL